MNHLIFNAPQRLLSCSMQKRSLIVLCAFVIGAAVAGNEGQLWKWTCNSKNQCIRQEYNSSAEYLSVEMCRLVCGNYGAFWPIPRQFNRSTVFVKVHPNRFNFKIDAPGKPKKYFEEVVGVFQSNLFAECGPNCNEADEQFVNVEVTFTSGSMDLDWTTDESYRLQTTDGTWQIIAPNFYGARHGLETLSQMVAPYPDGLVMLKSALVLDKPYYPHRSLLLDTARNYFSVKAIKRQLDGMGSSKLNYLHWHITDSQSFPFVSKQLPNLSALGAYSDKQVYTAADITELVHYALLRGVRIIMEVDAPAHAGNGWQWGPAANLGNLAVCINQQPWRQYCVEAPCGQLNPANQNVYDVLKMLYNDLTDLLPQNELFHMGGDEIVLNCWNTTQEIIDYLHAQGKGQTKSDFLDLWGEFQEKALAKYDELLGHKDSTIMLWSSELTTTDVIQKYLDPKRYVIQTWVPSTDPLPNDLLNKGYRLVISTKNAWYLDHGFWGTTTYYGWRTVYNNKLTSHKNVLGGEVCMWSEFLSEEALDGRVWPRAAAAAERLWANPSTKSDVAESRMHRQRERLVKRGIEAETLTPQWCYQNEGQCG
ncbi:chitooligosaccharidolytic beta-N-acetylglucosaminidase [Atheta coriaria]|uniref:chitooligosaccharidolytic beta-N-acetylglucosaminidase n=1 Tax=Dalotia coriaria TaxID=877792 RepID=UPI0031F39643